MKLSIIIPAYNEALGIGNFVKELLITAGNIEKRWNMDVSFCFVDDGSSDNTVETLQQLDFGHHDCKLHVLSRNFGKESALTAGIYHSDACDAAIMIDADLEHPPTLMEDLVETWLETKADSVYYYKNNRRHEEGALKANISNFFYGLMNFGGKVKLTKDAGDYRLINARFMKALRDLDENQRFMKGLYSWVGFKQVGLPFKPGKRQAGISNFSNFSLLLLVLDGLTSFTTAPLRLMMIGGLLVSVLSVFYGLYIISEALFFPGVEPGIASILTLIAFFGGVQILCLGLIGEYVGRAVYEAKGRPAFIVKDHIEIKPKAKSLPSTRRKTAARKTTRKAAPKRSTQSSVTPENVNAK